MSDLGSNFSAKSAARAFEDVIFQASSHRKAKLPPPFSIRFTESERARLDQEAGKRSLAAYIRLRLFADSVPSYRTKENSRKPKAPKIDQIALAKVLGALGQSRLSSNLNQIAKAANMGALPVTPELIKDLQDACVEIRAIRQMLVKALGLKQGG